MNELVQIDKNSHAFTTTLALAEVLSVEHRSVRRLVINHISYFVKYDTAFQMHYKKAKNKPISFFKLSEEQASFLMSLMKNSEIVLEFKFKLVKEFSRMKQELARIAGNQNNEQWQYVRKDGKAVYHQKTDVIKPFVDYATAQGSKSAKMYYSNLAKMENKALFLIEQKYPNVREVLNVKQLMQVATADQIVEKALADGMEQELPYKEIYALAKDRVIQFSEILGKSPVIEMLESPQKKEK